MRAAVVLCQFSEASPGTLEYLNSLVSPDKAPLTLPIDAAFIVSYNEDTEDEYADTPWEGEFNSPSPAQMELYLGPNGDTLQIIQPGSQVLTHCNPTTMRGVGFGSGEAFRWGGIDFKEYGIFALFWETFSEINVPNTDELHWLWDLQENEQLRQQAYMSLRGYAGSRMIYLRTRGPLTYSVYVF